MLYIPATAGIGCHIDNQIKRKTVINCLWEEIKGAILLTLAVSGVPSCLPAAMEAYNNI